VGRVAAWDGLCRLHQPSRLGLVCWLSGKACDTGVDTLKTDFGERIPHIDVVYHDGSDAS